MNTSKVQYIILHYITLFLIWSTLHYDLSTVGYIALEWYVYTPVLAYGHKAVTVPPSLDRDHDREVALTPHHKFESPVYTHSRRWWIRPQRRIRVSEGATIIRKDQRVRLCTAEGARNS